MQKKCFACGKDIETGDATFDVALTMRGTGILKEEKNEYDFCEDCAQRVMKNMDGIKNAVDAVLSGNAYFALPFEMPKVGDSVFEVIAGDTPVVESVITKIQGTRFEAECKDKHMDAGTISFQLLDISVDPHDEDKCLFLDKKTARANKSWRFREKGA